LGEVEQKFKTLKKKYKILKESNEDLAREKAELEQAKPSKKLKPSLHVIDEVAAPTYQTASEPKELEL